MKDVRFLKYTGKRHLEMYYSGREGRIKALEQILPTLEREGTLATIRHKGAKVYFIPRKNGKKILHLEHEVACTQILVSLWRCRMEESEIMPERVFRGNDIVPDFGLRYSARRGTMLLCEFCTEKNFSHGGVVKGKLTRYVKALTVIEEKAEREATVLFVIDADRRRIREFVERMKPVLSEGISGLTGEARYPFFFADYKTFKSVPIGKALTSKIYLWHDGKEWALTDHD